MRTITTLPPLLLALALLIPRLAVGQEDFIATQAAKKLAQCEEELAAGRFDEAKAAADSAMNLKPDLMEALVCKGKAAAGMGDLARADALLSYYIESVGIQGADPSVLSYYEQLQTRIQARAAELARQPKKKRNKLRRPGRRGGQSVSIKMQAKVARHESAEAAAAAAATAEGSVTAEAEPPAATAQDEEPVTASSALADEEPVAASSALSDEEPVTASADEDADDGLTVTMAEDVDVDSDEAVAAALDDEDTVQLGAGFIVVGVADEPEPAPTSSTSAGGDDGPVASAEPQADDKAERPGRIRWYRPEAQGGQEMDEDTAAWLAEVRGETKQGQRRRKPRDKFNPSSFGGSRVGGASLDLGRPAPTLSASGRAGTRVRVDAASRRKAGIGGGVTVAILGGGLAAAGIALLVESDAARQRLQDQRSQAEMYGIDASSVDELITSEATTHDQRLVLTLIGAGVVAGGMGITLGFAFGGPGKKGTQP